MQIPFDSGRSAVLALTLATLLGCSAGASAHDTTAGDLVIGHPWARATPTGAQVAGGYLSITNKGTTPDRLIGGTFAASSGFQLHAMSMAGGIMTMRPAGPLDIPPGATVTLDPSGLHVMLTGLKHGLKKGETVAGTLVFDHAGTVPVEFEVDAIGARGPSGQKKSDRAGHSMSGMDMN